ncbi:MAG: hypothetical protein ACTMKY_13205 [Dermabacteraceae bacterium]
MSPSLTAPDTSRTTTTEAQFTELLGTYFSATRGEADQRMLSRAVREALHEATSAQASLNGRWLHGDSWRWQTRGNGHKPDMVVTDRDHCWTLTLEAKSFGAAVNASSLANLRRDTAVSDERLSARGLTRDVRSREISAAWMGSDTAWDQPHTRAECGWQTEGWTHRFATLDDTQGRHKAGAHQGDVYASQFAYLWDDITVTGGDLSLVDFIALLPSRESARKWARYLVSADRWHIASVRDFREGLAKRRDGLPDDQLAWLDYLITNITNAYAEPSKQGHVLAPLSELVVSFQEERDS